MLPRLPVSHRLLPLLLSAGLPAQAFQALQAPLGVPSVPHATSQMGSGMCVADFNGDGRVDIIVTPAAGGAFTMFRNDGQMQFTDVSATSGLGVHTQARCIQAADIDNDGDQDVFVGGVMLPQKLFINDGTGAFTEEAALRGLVHAEDNNCASFGDYDRDGWIDLAVGNRLSTSGAPGANRLYRNTGDGYFVDMTPAVNFVSPRMTFALAFIDFNEDMWPDLIEINERGSFAGANELYQNNGDGTFTAVATQYGAAAAIDGMGVDFVDAFNDGGLDIFATDTPIDHLFLVWDAALNRYTDASVAHGFFAQTEGWCANFFDYDNDGWQDLYVVHVVLPNGLFRNPGAPAAAQVPWTDTAAQNGLDQFWLQHTMSTADFDDDGQVDVLQRFDSAVLPFQSPKGLVMYRNNVAGGNWIKFRLEGTTSNRNGLGARIEVNAAGLEQRQYRRSGIGFTGGSDHRMHFGLGSAASVDLATITWPSGQRQYLTNVACNQIVNVTEPTISCAGPAPVGGSTTVTVSIPGDAGLLYVMPLSLSMHVGTLLPDGQLFPLDHDAVLDLTMDPFNAVFVGSVGVLDASGTATATLNVPPLPVLSGIALYSSALTIDAPTFPLVRTIITSPVMVTIF